MGWNDEQENSKRGMSTSSKVLLGIIACVIFIIILLIVLLMNIKSAFKISIDGKETTITKEELLTTIENQTYVNIEKFSKLVGYEYHKGEYKASTIDEEKCYVEGEKETTSFYLNDNTIYKLPINEMDETYRKFTVENEVKRVGSAMYAPIDAISTAFNVFMQTTNNELKIYTLDYLVKAYNTNVTQWGYESITEQSFENQKSLLYGCLIVRKSGGLYKVINLDNTKEIVLDRFTQIDFSENTEEFFVTNSSKMVGVVNLNGTTKIDPIYEEITVLDKDAELYLVKQSQKYGVVLGNGTSIIYPEYDSIGLKNSNIAENKYLILDELIPVCKNNKWGAFNKKGNLILKLEYDEFGYNSTSIEIDGVKEVVKPIIEIKRANGVVVKQANKYGLFSVTGRELVPVKVEGIYAINGVEDEENKYFMLYKGEEINLIKRLIEKNVIDDDNIEDTPPSEDENITNNTVTDNTINNIGNESLNNNIDM